MQCIQCQSKRVATGTLKGSHGVEAIFAPKGLRFGLRPAHGTPVESFACLDCGFVWCITPPKELEAFIRKHCDQEIDDSKS